MKLKSALTRQSFPFSPKKHIYSNSKHKKQKEEENGKINVEEILPFSISKCIDDADVYSSLLGKVPKQFLFLKHKLVCQWEKNK